MTDIVRASSKKHQKINVDVRSLEMPLKAKSKGRVIADSGSSKKIDQDVIFLAILAAIVAGMLVGLIAAWICTSHPYKDFDKAIVEMPNGVITIELDDIYNSGDTYTLTDKKGNQYVVQREDVTFIKEVE